MSNQETFDILEQMEDGQLEDRNIKTRTYLMLQKEEILQRLEEQEYELLNLRRNRYTYCLEELEAGLRMFGQGIKQLLEAYFPLMLQEKYLNLLCQGVVSAKVMHLRATIEKNWNILYKQLIRVKDNEPDVRLRKIKKQDFDRLKKGSNCKIPKESTCILEMWLLQNFNDPYPNQLKKAEMARLSGLSIYQVNNWFINARERIVKKFHKKETIRQNRQLSQS